MKKPVRRVMTLNDIRSALGCLEQREQLIAKLAILVGMRPSEIFALTWGRVAVNFADVMQRVYRGLVDTPKTQASVREAALTDGLLRDLESWRSLAGLSGSEDWVFPSERLYALASPSKPTPLRKDNVWHRNMLPKLKAVGLEWCNFQVMRRTHATLMRELKADPKLVATQMGHSVDVSLNVYAQSPVEGRAQLVNALEGLLVH